MATVPIIDQFYNLPFMDDRLSHALDTTYTLWMFVLVWPLIGLAIITFGWIEDFAAKRSPRMWPNGVKKKGAQKKSAQKKGASRARH